MADEEDKEYETLLAEKRHKELASTLKDIAVAMRQKNDDGVIKAIEKQETAVRVLADSLKNIPKPQSNHGEVVTAINKMSQQILNGLAEIKQSVERPRNVTMKIKRKFGGYIDEVVITE